MKGNMIMATSRGKGKTADNERVGDDVMSTPENTEQAAASGVDTTADFEVRESDAEIVSTRSEKPNPLLNAFRQSLESGKTYDIPVRNQDHAKVAMNHLRRASKTVGAGLSVRHDADAGVVRFRARVEKIGRKYTSDDVREWALANGYTEDVLRPRIKPEVRAAYKEAVANKAASVNTQDDAQGDTLANTNSEG